MTDRVRPGKWSSLQIHPFPSGRKEEFVNPPGSAGTLSI